MSCCETQNLAVGYGAPLLRDIALHAERGKILALIGPNGAGKSTLLKTLAGQLAAQGGAVLLDGQDLTAYTSNARARKLALMLPHTARTELTSCFEVAAAGRYPYTGRLGILSDADRQQVHDALCLVRAEELEDRDFARISDGQRQRVLLARAVCQQPEILLLDEPTSFLDVKGKAELMDILQVLAHEKNVAVIVTLHELELAQRLADAVVCVAPSGVSAVLAPQDAFAQDNICALFGLTTDQYAVLFAGSGAKPKPQFEHYIRSGQRLLRCGYTTGTCAALGAAGAARLLLTGHAPESVGLRTPKGIVVEVAPRFCRLTADGAACAIVKDGGDDIDATTGLPVIAAVTLLPGAPRTVTIDGGAGVGRVTKPGLDQPVGAAAINRVPRQMITEALDMAAAEHFTEVLLVGHVGKLVKLAGGIMNTHSRCADCRTELFCAHAALCGADAATCRALMDAATTDACLDILDAAQLREPVMASLLTAIETHLDRRAAGAFKVGAVLFSNRNGPLGQTKTADTLLKLWKEA